MPHSRRETLGTIIYKHIKAPLNLCSSFGENDGVDRDVVGFYLNVELCCKTWHKLNGVWVF